MPPPGPALRANLRILATTDLHMYLLPFDYFSGRAQAPLGLARLASRIEALRAEAANCLLLDNGDLLQGNPLGDYLAGPGAGLRPHPAIACLNLLGYDAATLGNHDFSYGVAALARILAGARYPVVLANARLPGRPAPFLPWVTLTRSLQADDGTRHPIRIGIIGFVPPQTPEWEPGLAGRLTCTDIIETARDMLPRMRAAGCDLIVALCHGGITPLPVAAGAENAALALAGLDVDAVICGHTHLVFPGPDIPPSEGIDPVAGRLMGKPAVQPGFWGSHLGVIDLPLTLTADGWSVTATEADAGAEVRVEDCRAAAPLPRLAAAVLPAHRATQRHFTRRAGRTQVALNSHFAQLGHDAGLALVAAASRWYVRRALRGTAAEGLPVLTGIAPFRSGGRGGPQNYTDIPAGRLTLRSLADLYLFPNSIAAIEMTGAALRDWLERAAAQFATLQPGVANGALLAPDFPGYNFDVIAGLGWQFDLSVPPLYAPDGRAHGAGPGRVRDLCLHGRPVADDARFVLATNSYRLGEHGLFAPLVAEAPRLLETDDRMRDIIGHYLRARRRVAPVARLGWRFAPLPGTSALFITGPGVPAPQGLDLRAEGFDGAGFTRWRLSL